MIEQLHFTWAESGLQGRGMFQVTAASVGLQDLSGELALLAQRLCRRPGGESRDAVSFGWIDARGHRFAFRRILAGRTGDGRPGNFAAHVLVAPDGMITMADLLHAQCAPGLWWDGQPEAERTLPRLGRQALCPYLWPRPGAGEAAGQIDGEVYEAVAQLLALGAVGQIDGTWQAVLAAAGRCSTVMPGPFAALPSFSTLEDGETAEWFQLAGAGPRRHPVEPASGPVGAAASLIVSGNGADTRRARAAADATNHGGPTQWREFIALAAAFRALLAEDPVDCADLLPALVRPGTAGEVLQIRRGRAVIADALVAGQRDVAAALAASAPGISGDLLRPLGIALADRGTADWGALVQVAVPLGRDVLDGLAEVALLAPDTDVKGWPGVLMQACLRSPALTQPRVPGLADSVAQADSLIPALSDREIPVEYRARVAQAALAAGTLSPAAFVGLTSAHPDLVNPTLLRLARDGQAGMVLAAQPHDDAVRTVAEIAYDLHESSRLDACDALWPRLDPLTALRLVISLNRLTWNQRAADWYAIADSVVREAVKADLEDTRQPLDPRRFLPACSRSPVGQAWKQLFAAVCRAAEHPSQGNLSWVTDALRGSVIAADIAACGYAVQAILPVVQPEQVPMVLPLLLGTVGARGLRSAIAAAERAAAERGPTSLTLEVIEVIAQFDQADRALIDACGRLGQSLDGRAWKILRERLQCESPETRRRLSAIIRHAKYHAMFPAGLRR